MAKYQLNISDSLKGQLEHVAKERGCTLRELMLDYLNFSWNVNKYVKEDSLVIIKKPDHEAEAEAIALPVPSSFLKKKKSA